MTFSVDHPTTFFQALEVTQKLLHQSAELKKKGSINAESERLVFAAYQSDGGTLPNRLELYSQKDYAFPQQKCKKLFDMIFERLRGKPLQHITGTQTFLSHEYFVNADVLIPRPETEILVTEAIKEISKIKKDSLMGIEIGLGSGAITIELLSAIPHLNMTSSECSPGAVTVTKKNATQILGPNILNGFRLNIVESADKNHIWQGFQAENNILADFIISNPPYMIESDAIEDEVKKHEPALALFAPEEAPLFYYWKILEGAHQYLSPEGMVFFEIPHQRSAEILRFTETFGFHCTVVKDLAQRDRVLIGKRK